MLFYSFFKTLVDQVVTVDLKNDVQIQGTLKSVDAFLNIKLDNIKVLNVERYPHMVGQKEVEWEWAGWTRCRACTEGKCLFSSRSLRLLPLLDGPQELLHPGLCRQICPSARCSGRCRTVGRRNEERWVVRGRRDESLH